METQASLDTYRSLRAGMVAAGLLLAMGLVFYALQPGVGIPPSISATFYSSLSTVFVATLLTVGLALIAVKGRLGVENTLLDVAGTLIPVVAFVPTPTFSSECPVPGRDCVPASLHPAVDINIRAYLTVGVVAIVVAWVRMTIAARTPTPWTLATRRGLIPPALIVVAFGVAYLAVRPVFIQFAHYTAAIGFFLLLMVVVWINGRRSVETVDPANVPAAWYRGVYRTIATLMLAALGGGVAMFAATGNQNAVVNGGGTPFPVIFWIEAVLLTLFVSYWVVQTVELWNYTVPPQAGSVSAAPRLAAAG
jgi:hypothetical protein